jgi:hypothetical protein
LDGNCEFRAQGRQFFQFLAVSAGQSAGHDDTVRLRDMAFELV